MRLFKNGAAAVVTGMTALLLSCGGRHGEYEAAYAVFDSVPYNVETNVAATTAMVKKFPGSYMFRSNYPEYNAVVRYGIVAVADSGKIRKVIANCFDRMADRIGIYESDIRSVKNAPAFQGWVMVAPPCPAPVQMLVTDSATVVIHATMEFTSPQTDSAGVVYPAVEAVAADLEHMIKALRPEEPLSQQ